MQATAAQLAQLLNGKVEGDPETTVSKPAQIEHAQATDLSFFDNPKYENYVYTTQAGILLVPKDFKPSQKHAATLVRVDNVRESLAILLEHFSNAVQAEKGQRSPNAFIDSSAKLDESVSVGHFAVVKENVSVGANTIIEDQVYLGKGVKIGQNCRIFPGVKIYFDCEIGDNCILYSNAVIGADGFGYAPQADGSWRKVPQVGNVVLENNVEIGACVCIDRAALGSTTIKTGAKIDNLVHIAHNVVIGEHSVMAAQVGIAGSTYVGSHVQLGGQVGLSGHISVANGTKVQAQSGIASTVKIENTALFGSPAIDYKDYVKAYIVFKTLPDLSKKVRALEKEIEAMKGA